MKLFYYTVVFIVIKGPILTSTVERGYEFLVEKVFSYILFNRSVTCFISYTFIISH